MIPQDPGKKIQGIVVASQRNVRKSPRLHDLRYSMATHRLVTWYREGADVQVHYLGSPHIGDMQE
jgi:hypothetical protein